MHGAMHGLADGLDPDSAYLDVNQVGSMSRKATPLARGQTGIELTRQYYLRVIAARDGSPAAKAGLQPGDYIRAIDGQSTRDTSVFEGTRAAARQAGHQGAAHRAPRQRRRSARLELTREDLPAAAGEGAHRRARHRLPARRGVRQEHAPIRSRREIAVAAEGRRDPA